MNNTKITRILSNHGILNQTVDGRVMADSMAAHEPLSWIDVTDWSFERLAGWLGYGQEEALGYMAGY